MKEEWKTIKESPQYEVSNFGVVRKKKDGYIKKSYLDKGKLVVWLPNKQGDGRNYRIAQLVVRAFVPKANAFKTLKVKHKNGNLQDNRLSNLTCNAQDKTKLSKFELSKRKGRDDWILCYKSKNEIVSFKSVRKCARRFNVTGSSFASLKRGVEKKGWAVNLVSELEAKPYCEDRIRDMQKRAEVQEKIRVFLDYVQEKYGIDWADNDALESDPIVKAHWKYMQTVH